MERFLLRRVRDADFAPLTTLLHRAYAPLAERGMHYVATHQSVDVTRSRASQGECWVAEHDGDLAGTITLVPPSPAGPKSRGCAFYDRPDVAKFGQLGVDPSWKGRGVGGRLMDHVEERARALGAAHIACDTSEGAYDLIAMYQRRGYRVVDRADWRPHVNYASVVLALDLMGFTSELNTWKQNGQDH